MVAIEEEIGRYFQQLRDNDGPTGTIGAEMAGISVQKRLVDPVKVDNTEFIAHEIEEAPRSVEGLPDTGGRENPAVTRHADVEPSIEKFAQRLTDACILDRLSRNTAGPRSQLGSL